MLGTAMATEPGLLGFSKPDLQNLMALPAPLFPAENPVTKSDGFPQTIFCNVNLSVEA